MKKSGSRRMETERWIADRQRLRATQLSAGQVERIAAHWKP